MSRLDTVYVQTSFGEALWDGDDHVNELALEEIVQVAGVMAALLDHEEATAGVVHFFGAEFTWESDPPDPWGLRSAA